MAQSDLNVSNLALSLMGHRERIAVLATDTSVAAVQCNAMVDDCKKALLRMHPWNFAIKRRVITPYQDFAVSNVTFVSSQLIEVTHAATTYVAGQYVTLTGIAGATAANGTWEVASVPGGTTVRLTALGITTSDILGTYTASDTDYIRRSPAFTYAYLYDNPSDIIRLLEVNELHNNADWRVEGDFIVSDSDSLQLRYIYDVTDYTTMDPMFYQTLGHYLAYNLCDVLSASDAKKNELHAYLYGGQGKRGVLPQSRFTDATEDSMQIMEANEWLDSRVSYSVERGAA